MTGRDAVPIVNDELLDLVLAQQAAHITPHTLLLHLLKTGWAYWGFVLDDHAQEWVLTDAAEDEPLRVVVPMPSFPDAAEFDRLMRAAVKFVALVEGWRLTVSVEVPKELRDV